LKVLRKSPTYQLPCFDAVAFLNSDGVWSIGSPYSNVLLVAILNNYRDWDSDQSIWHSGNLSLPHHFAVQKYFWLVSRCSWSGFTNSSVTVLSYSVFFNGVTRHHLPYSDRRYQVVFLALLLSSLSIPQKRILSFLCRAEL